MKDLKVPKGNGTLWDLCLSQDKEQASVEDTQSSVSSLETSLLIVGSKQVGKTSLIYHFQESLDDVKPTLALEYRYVRRTGRSAVKDVCHVWELGGGALFTSLLSTPITVSSLVGLSVVLLVDLSAPERLWVTTECLLTALRSKVDEVREVKLVQDKDVVKPFPVPLVILGGKYDIFQDFDPEDKKLICRCLRFIAHMNGASLQFYTSKDAGLGKKAKTLLSHHAFKTPLGKMICQDYNQPLLIPSGADSLQQIGGNDVSPGGDNQYNVWKLAYTTRYPQIEKGDSIVPDDPSLDPKFAESEIDRLRSFKHEELDLMRRDDELRQRLQKI